MRGYTIVFEIKWKKAEAGSLLTTKMINGYSYYMNYEYINLVVKSNPYLNIIGLTVLYLYMHISYLNIII